jgi:hypothetical protein
MLGRRSVVAFAVVAALVGVVGAPGAGSADTAIVAPPLSPTLAPTVLEVKVVRPPHRKIVHRRFVPWSEPSFAQAQQIITIEAEREGVSRAGLENRLMCESKLVWSAKNGQYEGIGQFASETFGRGMGSIGSRRVEVREERVRRVVAKRVHVMSDGSEVVVARWRVKQVVVYIERGMIPRDPPLTHAWAQVRIAAEAIAGRSAVSSSEWSCST